jgi:hypothetical protein
MHAILCGLALGIVFGRKILCSKSDPLNFTADATLFGLLSAIIHHGPTIIALDQVGSWFALLSAFYCGYKIRHYFHHRQVHNADSEPSPQSSLLP